MFSNLNKIVYFLISVFLSISFFIGGHLVSYAVFILIIGILILGVKNKSIKFQLNNSLISIIGFYLIHLFGVIYSSNKAIAFFDIEVKASLIIFPLLFLFTKKNILQFKNIFNKIFIISASTFSIFLIIRAFTIYYQTNNIASLLYESFAYNMHPTYLSMYMITSIIISVPLLKQQKSKINITLITFSILLNIATIIFSNSKAGYISSILVFSIIGFQILYRFSKKLSIIFTIMIISFSIILFKTNGRFQVMFKIVSIYQNILDNPNTYKEGTGLRILSWNTAINIIKDNPVFGVGTGDIKPELFKEYKKLGYTKNLKKQMNVHNQFLETWLGQGIIGFLLLLLMFIIPLINAIKRKNLILQSFILLIFINFLFESMLNTQAGTVFFGFFYSLFVLKDE